MYKNLVDKKTCRIFAPSKCEVKDTNAKEHSKEYTITYSITL